MSANLQLEWSREEDRLLLSVVGAAGIERFWLTRRQCLALVGACRDAKGEAPPLKVSPSPQKASSGPAAGPETSAAKTAVAGKKAVTQQKPGAAGQAGPARLARLGLGKTAKGLRLVLEAEESTPVKLMLKAEDQLSLVRTIRFLAEQAQWDLSAAEARLTAQAEKRKTARLH